MTIIGVLMPIALLLGGLGLAAFVWSLRSGQYEDLDGAAERILHEDDPDETRTAAPDGRTSGEHRP